GLGAAQLLIFKALIPGDIELESTRACSLCLCCHVRGDSCCSFFRGSGRIRGLLIVFPEECCGVTQANPIFVSNIYIAMSEDRLVIDSNFHWILFISK